MSTQSEFSVVMPVKDEADLLRYSLPSVYALHPDEVVLVMEPNEATAKVAVDIANRFKGTKTRLLGLKEDSKDWRLRHAYARRKGFMEARNDMVLTTDVDKIVDPKVREHLHLIGNDGVGLVSFSEASYPFDLRMFVGKLIQKLGYPSSFMGLYAFSKKAWLETENRESAKKVVTSEDTHLHESIKKKFKTVFVKTTRNVNLRPKESKRYQYLMGVERKKHGASFAKVFVSSILYLRPLTLLGFLNARK